MLDAAWVWAVERAGALEFLLDAKMRSLRDLVHLTPAHFYRKIRAASASTGPSIERLKIFLVFAKVYRGAYEGDGWEWALSAVVDDVKFWEKLDLIEDWQPMLRAVECVSGLRMPSPLSFHSIYPAFYYEFCAPVRPDAFGLFNTAVLPAKSGRKAGITFYKKNSVPPVPANIKACWDP